MVTQLQPDVRAYLHGGEVIKRYIRVEWLLFSLYAKADRKVGG